MLILDKQKAVEHLMALTEANVTEPPQPARRRRSAQRIATYERRPVPETIAPPSETKVVPTAKKRRRAGSTIRPAPATI